MSDPYELPAITSQWWLLTCFMICLVLFHLAFVWPRNLSKTAWKYIDYFWLSAALIGVMAAVTVGRQHVANTLLEMARNYTDFSARTVVSALQFGTSEASCRKFVRTEYSPPPEVFERLQKEYDSQCVWFKNATKLLSTSPFSKRSTLTMNDLGAAPPIVEDKWPIANLRESINQYNAGVSEVARLTEASKRSEFEVVLMLLGPFFLAGALALRMAKNTGEILHEKQNK